MYGLIDSSPYRAKKALTEWVVSANQVPSSEEHIHLMTRKTLCLLVLSSLTGKPLTPATELPHPSMIFRVRNAREEKSWGNPPAFKAMAWSTSSGEWLSRVRRSDTTLLGTASVFSATLSPLSSSTGAEYEPAIDVGVLPGEETGEALPPSAHSLMASANMVWYSP